MPTPETAANAVAAIALHFMRSHDVALRQSRNATAWLVMAAEIVQRLSAVPYILVEMKATLDGPPPARTCQKIVYFVEVSGTLLRIATQPYPCDVRQSSYAQAIEKMVSGPFFKPDDPPVVATTRQLGPMHPDACPPWLPVLVGDWSMRLKTHVSECAQSRPSQRL